MSLPKTPVNPGTQEGFKSMIGKHITVRNSTGMSNYYVCDVEGKMLSVSINSNFPASKWINAESFDEIEAWQ